MQNKPNLLNAQMNVSYCLTKHYENKRLCRRGEKQTQSNPNKAKQTRSEFTPKGAEIPTGELLGAAFSAPSFVLLRIGIFLRRVG